MCCCSTLAKTSDIHRRWEGNMNRTSPTCASVMDASDRHTVLSLSPFNATCGWYGQELMDDHLVGSSLAECR